PGRRLLQVRAVVTPAATWVANDCTRSCWGGGLNTAPLLSPAMGHVAPCWRCCGLGTFVAVFPRPPPSWPTITSEVGMLFAPAANVRLFVRLIVRLPGGAVMTIGDHPRPAFGFNALQVAVAFATTAPQV